MGERLEPAQARPVPFCRHGLALPPETIARVFVAAVPRRRAACSARTLWCTRGPAKRTPKAASSSLTFFAAEPPRIGASAIAAHLHDRAGGPGDGAADQQEVLARVDAHDLKALLGHALVAHLA